MSPEQNKELVSTPDYFLSTSFLNKDFATLACVTLLGALLFFLNTFIPTLEIKKHIQLGVLFLKESTTERGDESLAVACVGSFEHAVTQEAVESKNVENTKHYN